MTQIANNWFPENERATASSIVFIFMVLGNSFMEFYGPLVVKGSNSTDGLSH